MFNINIPYEAKQIINTLQANGYDAYVVGGCVRDSLLGITPKDWDICTSATPEEVKACITNKTIDTGLKHGTITVVCEDNNYEVTTYRRDGKYSDCRRPNDVEFVSDLAEDLSRRDFTINAMAYNDTDGLIDKFGGVADIQNKVIACVGNPKDRFDEDALRILRALRFASKYGFSIEEETKKAIHQNRGNLLYIAIERIQSEFSKLLMGRGVLDILLEFSDVIVTIVPEMSPCVGFDQNNKYHQYTVYDHIAHAVDNYKGEDFSVRLALFLHDIGKPACYTEDEKGGHFKGHSVPGHKLSERVLNRLRFDNKTKNEVAELVLFHDSVVEPTEKTVKRWLNKIGEQRFRQLLDVRQADILAHAEGTYESRLERCNALRQLLEQILEQEQCFSLKNLAINGYDLIQIGVPEGKVLGEILKEILDKVIGNELQNEYEALREYAKGLYLYKIYFENNE